MATNTIRQNRANMDPGSTIGTSAPEIPNIEWISCKDFTVETGEQQIRQYMETWDMRHPGWLHSIRFLREQELDFKKQYRYRVQWSLPSQTSPVPRVTASVYFLIEVSSVRPDSEPVEVHFLVETRRLKHVPGRTRFTEQWLLDVLHNKTLLMNTVAF